MATVRMMCAVRVDRMPIDDSIPELRPIHHEKLAQDPTGRAVTDGGNENEVDHHIALKTKPILEPQRENDQQYGDYIGCKDQSCHCEHLHV
ncbi:MAG TPA: hypothetical protein VMT64_00225 [Candidatus Binataceae bacterium]|nr:hypothetical protein [Candidatus Binataceae bacterium]